jgi:hypothetical protein
MREQVDQDGFKTGFYYSYTPAGRPLQEKNKYLGTKRRGKVSAKKSVERKAFLTSDIPDKTFFSHPFTGL